MMLYLFRDRHVQPVLRNEYIQANDNVLHILRHQEIVVTENHIRLLPGLIIQFRKSRETHSAQFR